MRLAGTVATKVTTVVGHSWIRSKSVFTVNALAMLVIYLPSIFSGKVDWKGVVNCANLGLSLYLTSKWFLRFLRLASYIIFQFFTFFSTKVDS